MLMSSWSFSAVCHFLVVVGRVMHQVPIQRKSCLYINQIPCPPHRKGQSILHPLHKSLLGKF